MGRNCVATVKEVQIKVLLRNLPATFPSVAPPTANLPSLGPEKIIALQPGHTNLSMVLSKAEGAQHRKEKPLSAVSRHRTP